MNEKVDIHFFNVGEGDSIVIEFVSKTTNYVVIDSNLIDVDSQKRNPAYEFLSTKKASKISTLIVSHLHQDHYNGIEYLLNNFEIEKIVVPPFLSVNSAQYNKIIRRFQEKIREFTDLCYDDDTFKYGESLAHLIHFLTNNDHKVEQVSGNEYVLRFPGVERFTGKVYLPLSRIRGVLHRLIEHSDYNLNQFPEMNDSSIAFCLNCFGHNILLTGDSTLSQWNEHERQMRRDAITCLDTDFLKVSHHGSKYDNNDKLYTYLLRKQTPCKYAFTSADGVRHPDKELFDLIQKFHLSPYCTNFSQFCLPSNVIQFKSLADFPKQMHPFLFNYMEKKPIPCQGNIHLSIDDQQINVTTSTGFPCVYRE